MHTCVLIYIVIVNEEPYIILYRNDNTNRLNLSALIKMVIYCRSYLLMLDLCDIELNINIGFLLD